MIFWCTKSFVLERYVACTFELNKRTRYKKRMNMQTSWVKTWSKKSTKNVNLQKVESDTNCQFCIIRYEISNVYSTLHHAVHHNSEYSFHRTYRKDMYSWMNDHDESIFYDHISSIYFYTSLNSRPSWIPFDHINFYLKASK